MSNPTRAGARRATTETLVGAARQAGRAPSIFNTQPWRWRILATAEGGAAMELWADRDRQLTVVDPDGRLLTLSCGTALHHARTALAAAGHAVAVDRLPDAKHPDLLARVRLAGPHRPDPVTAARSDAMTRRRTDRRAYSQVPVPEWALRRLRAAVEADGAHLHVVREDQMPMLAVAVARAAAAEMADPAYRNELMRWTNRPVWSGDGVPASTAVYPGPRRVPVRDFAPASPHGLTVGEGGDRGAAYAIIFGDADDAAGWLRGGEALSALVLTAAATGLSVSPMSDVIEVPAARELMRGVLSGVGEPYLAVRIGLATASDEPPASPRREPVEFIEVVT
jgi:nitroreductase